jgi:secreted trypsin-like serine protease
VDLPIVDIKQCKSEHASGLVHEQVHLCAGCEEGAKDACQCDSGGPGYREVLSRGVKAVHDPGPLASLLASIRA